MRSLITVIVPAYNRPAQLREALDSIVAQKGRGNLFDVEIVVVDDASDDDICGVAAAYPVRYVRHPVNRGLTAARNTGIQVSHGQYVAFLDDDDVWLPRKLQVQLSIIESDSNVGLVYSPFITVMDGKRVAPAYSVGPAGIVFEQLLMSGNFIGVMTVLVRRTALDKVGGFDGDMLGLEDYDLWLRLARHFPFAFVPGPVAEYRASSQGKFVREIANGVSRQLHRRVIDKALQSVPGASGAFRDAVTDRMELRNFYRIRDHLQDPEMLPQMIAHLREYPRLARYADVRDTFARIVRKNALASRSFLQTATTVCESFELSGAGALQMRRLFGRVWIEVAMGSLLVGKGGVAVRAVGRGMQHDPTQLIECLLPSPARWLRAHPATRSRIRRFLRRPLR